MKPNAEYKKDERQRKRAAGMIYVQEWVHIDDVPKLKEFAAKLRKGSNGQNPTKQPSSVS